MSQTFDPVFLEDPHESDPSMSTRRKSVLPTFRDLEEQIYLRFVRVPLILSQQLFCDEALLLSYLLNHRKMVGMSNSDAVNGKFWVMKSQLQRDLKFSPKDQRMTLDELKAREVPAVRRRVLPESLVNPPAASSLIDIVSGITIELGKFRPQLTKGAFHEGTMPTLLETPCRPRQICRDANEVCRLWSGHPGSFTRRPVDL